MGGEVPGAELLLQGAQPLVYLVMVADNEVRLDHSRCMSNRRDLASWAQSSRRLQVLPHALRAANHQQRPFVTTAICPDPLSGSEFVYVSLGQHVLAVSRDSSQ